MTASAYHLLEWVQERLGHLTEQRLGKSLTLQAPKTPKSLLHDKSYQPRYFMFAATRYSEPPMEAIKSPVSHGNNSNTSIKRAPFVQCVEEQGYDEWGYILIRTDYSSEERWKHFQAEFNKIIEDSMDKEVSEGSGVERVRDMCTIQVMIDPKLEGLDATAVRELFHECKDAGIVSEGLDHSCCLIADTASIASVLDLDTKGKREGLATPYLIAVDVNYGPATIGKDIGYEGIFNVAIDSLVPDLYPLLGTHTEDPYRLWAQAKPVWKTWSPGI